MGASETTTENHTTTTTDHFTSSIGDDIDFSAAGNLLHDSIDFDDIFVSIHDGDVLPDLEMDPELLAEFSLSLTDAAGDEYYDHGQFVYGGAPGVDVKDDIKSVDIVGQDSSSCCFERRKKKKKKKVEEETASLDETKKGGFESKEEVSVVLNSPDNNNNNNTNSSSSSTRDTGGHKWSSNKSINNTTSNSTNRSNPSNITGHNSQGKRKAKVDWTPELHRRFVQAVEQLGVDKAVPSRILELMGIDCLTRHNIASHLQKYRSHRKHLLAREAEAASWSQKRQMYGAAAAMGSAGGKGGIAVNPWHAPTIGFPPAMAPPPPPPSATTATIHPHHFRPLHVWGHPTHNQSMIPPLPMWAPPAHDPAAFWHPPHLRVPNGMTPARPCFPPTLPTTRFAASPVPGHPPHAMYRPDLRIAGAGQPSQTELNPPNLDFHPTKESIDAAIGDVLAKPYLPLPIGLKPPAVDSVLVELQRQGVPKIPPSCA